MPLTLLLLDFFVRFARLYGLFKVVHGLHICSKEVS